MVSFHVNPKKIFIQDDEIAYNKSAHNKQEEKQVESWRTRNIKCNKK